MRKTHFLIIDTETTIDGEVVDFGAVLCDRHGNVISSAAVMVRENFEPSIRETKPLFHMEDGDPIWKKANLSRRYAAYDRMVDDGRRNIASVAGINNWLAKALKYNPILTAYNLQYDLGKMRNTGINCDLFEKKFCLWHAAAHKYVKNKAFRQFILDGHHFNNRTKAGNMTFKTNADIMAKFILQDQDLADEPHTAFEDALHYELPILKDIVKAKKKSEYMDAPAYAWQGVQVKDWFKPK
jgi:hypothetical protein